MGDMADDYDDNGMEEYILHLQGECDTEYPCPYCYEEEMEKSKKRTEAASPTPK